MYFQLPGNKEIGAEYATRLISEKSLTNGHQTIKKSITFSVDFERQMKWRLWGCWSIIKSRNPTVDFVLSKWSGASVDFEKA
jgi:hypothetical protein